MSKLELANEKTEDNLSNGSRQVYPIKLFSKQSLQFLLRATKFNSIESNK